MIKFMMMHATRIKNLFCASFDEMFIVLMMAPNIYEYTVLLIIIQISENMHISNMSMANSDFPSETRAGLFVNMIIICSKENVL